MYTLINTEDISTFAAQGHDILRFLSCLNTVYTVHDAPNPFEECHVRRAWGLVILTFFAPSGKVTLPMNVSLLDILEEDVIKDDGTIVNRYKKLAEELLKTAVDRLHGLPILVTTRD